MKTIKIFLSIAGIVLTSLSFGQHISMYESDSLIYSAYYNSASNRIEHQLSHFTSRTSSGDHFDVPVLSRTYYAPIDFDIGVETWMTKPFENRFYEEVLQVESWMESPFDSGYYEEEPEIESWMTRPFESVKKI